MISSWRRCAYILSRIAVGDHKALENAADAAEEAFKIMPRKVRVQIQAFVTTVDPTDDVSEKVDNLLCFGTVKDAFSDAGIDLERIEVECAGEVES